MILEVVDGGLLTTVQDAGRPAWTHIGVPESGAADPWSHAVANLVAGNEPGAAALELTIVGPTLVVRDDGVIGLAGADLGARVVGGRRLASGRSHRIQPGETIEIPGADGATGARAYLALPGGVDVPLVLGSRSTCLAGGFGGLDGRAIRAGDVVTSAGTNRANDAAEVVWPDPGPADARATDDAAILRVLRGPAAGLEDLVAEPWRVAPAADRVGVRLEGRSLPPGIGGEALTHGVPSGAIQVPSDGRPIVLSVDHQTTGGYRVVAVVVTADLAVLGQLRPGDRVVLVEVDRAEAIAALREQRQALAAGAAALRDAAGWDRLTGSAGG